MTGPDVRCLVPSQLEAQLRLLFTELLANTAPLLQAVYVIWASYSWLVSTVVFCYVQHFEPNLHA